VTQALAKLISVQQERFGLAVLCRKWEMWLISWTAVLCLDGQT